MVPKEWAWEPEEEVKEWRVLLLWVVFLVYEDTKHFISLFSLKFQTNGFGTKGGHMEELRKYSNSFGNVLVKKKC